MIKDPGIGKTRRRVQHQDGTFSDYLTVRFAPQALQFQDIDSSDPQVKRKDIAQLRYLKALARGERHPIIITYLSLLPDRPAAAIFPHLTFTTEDGERLLSANSAITYTLRLLLSKGWLHYQAGHWQIATPRRETHWQERAAAVLHLLTSQQRLHISATPGQPLPARLTFDAPPFDVYRNLIPISRCGFLSDVVHRQQPRLIFNTAFFLLEHDDFLSHHSALGEPYNLWVRHGVIHRPPLYRRGTIFASDEHRWRVGFFSLNDISITLPNALRLQPADLAPRHGALPFTLNNAASTAVTLYTRYYGVAEKGRVLGYTPSAAGRFELTVIDRRIVSWKMGGHLLLPQNGFIISFAPGTLAASAQQELQDILPARPRIDYHFARPEHQGVDQALQAGPMLLQNGHTPLTNTYLEEKEQFWPSRALPNGDWQIGVVSTDYDTNVDSSRHGRVGLGIDKTGHLILTLAAGVNSGMGVPGIDSYGATLVELTDALAAAGAVDAVNLDGGGSTQAYYQGGQAVVPGDRRGRFQVHYERMVPAVGILP